MIFIWVDQPSASYLDRIICTGCMPILKIWVDQSSASYLDRIICTGCMPILKSDIHMSWPVQCQLSGHNHLHWLHVYPKEWYSYELTSPVLSTYLDRIICTGGHMVKLKKVLTHCTLMSIQKSDIHMSWPAQCYLSGQNQLHWLHVYPKEWYSYELTSPVPAICTESSALAACLS